MRMFVLISRFQQPLDEINRYLALHSEWVKNTMRLADFLSPGGANRGLAG